LLLLTNDGEFSQLMTHPSFGVRKTYMVRVDGLVDFDSVEKLRKGAFIDGTKVVPLSVRVGRRTKAFSAVEITIREGRNREVRRLLARSGLKVRQLKRVRIGSLGVKGVKRGGYRPLSRHEVEELVACAREGRD
jgi:23S rRNA pseudouridine2605 synthase